LGIFQSFSIAYISSLYSTAMVFALIIVILMFKPIGLFGKAVRR
ncbi:MAG: branched-chain amino acid ABC transporter permease, partial [Alicyclobacillaceae bacterium]|nr:branched-chain amino acid ABC transporter permease [Alicyclobacillaceae bacterium]